MSDLLAVASLLKKLAADLEADAIRDSSAVTPRLLLGVREVMERTGLGRDEAGALIKRAGAVKISSRLVARPSDLDAVLLSLRETPT
jgi:hypothetical protein